MQTVSNSNITGQPGCRWWMIQTKYINLIYLSKKSKKSEISGSSRLADMVGAEVNDEMTFHKGQVKILWKFPATTFCWKLSCRFAWDHIWKFARWQEFTCSRPRIQYYNYECFGSMCTFHTIFLVVVFSTKMMPGLGYIRCTTCGKNIRISGRSFQKDCIWENKVSMSLWIAIFLHRCNYWHGNLTNLLCNTETFSNFAFLLSKKI